MVLVLAFLEADLDGDKDFNASNGFRYYRKYW